MSTAASSWDSNGSNVFFNGGNLGIGTSSPAYKLDVMGDARISNNLIVGGGLITTDKLDATTKIQAGDVVVNNDLNVTGNSKFVGNIIAPRGLTFDPNTTIGIGYSSPTEANSGGSLIFGHTGPIPVLPSCINVNNAKFQFIDGYIQSVSTSGNSALTLGSAPWDGSGIIEVEGTNADVYAGGVPTNGLLVNYFCGRNIYLGTGTGTGSGDPGGKAGSKVFTGNELYARKNVQIGVSWQAIDPNVSLNVVLDGTSSGLKLWPGTNPNVKMIHDNYDQFVVKGDGRTEIATGAADAFTVRSSATGPINFKVKNTGFVYAREVNVLTTTFPDYVFNPDYKLLSLEDVEKYIQKNKHLPRFENSKYYEENGISLKETVLKQQETIEEMMLYIIELKKEIATVKKQ